MEKILSQVYYVPSSPASYSGKEVVCKEAAKALYPKITHRMVATRVSKQFTYTIHKPVYYHFKTNRVFAEGIDYQWQADLGSVQKNNERFRYFLSCSYAWVVHALLDTVANIIKDVAKGRNFRKSLKKWGERGGVEFLNKVKTQMGGGQNQKSYKGF